MFYSKEVKDTPFLLEFLIKLKLKSICFCEVDVYFLITYRLDSE